MMGDPSSFFTPMDFISWVYQLPPVAKLTRTCIGTRNEGVTGPVATTLDASARDWSTRIELARGEHRSVSLPTNVLLTLETHGAFRPVEHEPGNTDRRQLGVRIEFP